MKAASRTVFQLDQYERGADGAGQTDARAQANNDTGTGTFCASVEALAALATEKMA